MTMRFLLLFQQRIPPERGYRPALMGQYKPSFSLPRAMPTPLITRVK
jgi:hypothetical protein